MIKTYTLFHLTILRTNKSQENLKQKSLNKIYKRYSKSLNAFRLSPSDKVVNNILKYADL